MGPEVGDKGNTCSEIALEELIVALPVPVEISAGSSDIFLLGETSLLPRTEGFLGRPPTPLLSPGLEGLTRELPAFSVLFERAIGSERLTGELGAETGSSSSARVSRSCEVRCPMEADGAIDRRCKLLLDVIPGLATVEPFTAVGRAGKAELPAIFENVYEENRLEAFRAKTSPFSKAAKD